VADVIRLYAHLAIAGLVLLLLSHLAIPLHFGVIHISVPVLGLAVAGECAALAGAVVLLARSLGLRPRLAYWSGLR
jgi:hypothetical protein